MRKRTSVEVARRKRICDKVVQSLEENDSFYSKSEHLNILQKKKQLKSVNHYTGFEDCEIFVTKNGEVFEFGISLSSESSEAFWVGKICLDEISRGSYVSYAGFFLKNFKCNFVISRNLADDLNFRLFIMNTEDNSDPKAFQWNIDWFNGKFL